MSQNYYSYPVTIKTSKIIKYHESPAHQGKLKHAVDFIIPEGTPIRAAYWGIVVDVKQDSKTGGKSQRYDPLGNYIEIMHQHEEYSIYEHVKLRGSLVRVGEKVRRGQIIGYSGKTGWIAHLGPHLHFDVHTYFGEGSNDYKTIKINWKKKKRKK